MISPYTIQQIQETSRIEEVIADYITLKRRGANLLGLCPFHDEKTPSFTVSPAKGIFKCFGCGKAGNAIGFIMEHEHMNYVEALRFLAQKYSIEIEEEKVTPEQQEKLTERELLYTLNSLAQKYYSNLLHTQEEGKAIGLSYFKERGFTHNLIEKFQLGYSLDQWDAFTSFAHSQGYDSQILEKSGLTIIKEDKQYDRFRGRVVFPIRNLSGKTIGFGARILKSNDKSPKYVNSPETEIYNKSNVLYGMYLAKSAITKEDNCYLVEGYTDVISMHQSGIENVVASSGTSLTGGQIKLIKRYTPNITILYDGDPAGIKASFRGINMILEEGMNVFVVLFPKGDDPDSFAQKSTPKEFKEFLSNNKKDFIQFKTSLFIEECDNNPIAKANLVKNIVETISVIPDNVIRSMYTKEIASTWNLEEQTLIYEVNKIRRSHLKKNFSKSQEKGPAIVEDNPLLKKPHHEFLIESRNTDHLERNIIRQLINYGSDTITIYNASDVDDENAEDLPENGVDLSMIDFMVNEISQDNSISFENPLYKKILDEFVKLYEDETPYNENLFIHHPDPEISKLSIELFTSQYEISENWKLKYHILVQTERMQLKTSALKAIYSLKLGKLEKIITSVQEQIKNNDNDEKLLELIEHLKLLNQAKKDIASHLGRIFVR